MLRCNGSELTSERAEDEEEARALQEACEATGFSLYNGRFVWYKRVFEEEPWTGRVNYTVCELSSPRDVDGNELKAWSDVSEEDLLDDGYWDREACKDLEVGEMGEVFSREVSADVVIVLYLLTLLGRFSSLFLHILQASSSFEQRTKKRTKWMSTTWSWMRPARVLRKL